MFYVYTQNIFTTTEHVHIYIKQYIHLQRILHGHGHLTIKKKAADLLRLLQFKMLHVQSIFEMLP